MLPPSTTVSAPPATTVPVKTPPAPVQLTISVSMTVETAFLLVTVTETGDVATGSLTVMLMGPAQVY